MRVYLSMQRTQFNPWSKKVPHATEQLSPCSSAGKESICNGGDPSDFDSWVRKIYWRRDRIPIPVFLGFPHGSDGKESAYDARDLGSIPGLWKSPGGGRGNPLQYSSLETPQGQRSLMGYSPWGHKESDMTEQLTRSLFRLLWSFHNIYIYWIPVHLKLIYFKKFSGFW